MNTGSDVRFSHPVWFLTMIAFAILVAALWFGRGFLIPLAITGLLFILSSAMVDRFKQVRLFGQTIPGWLAHVLSTTTVIGAIVLFGLVVSTSAEEIQTALPEYQERVAEITAKLEQVLGPQLVETVQRFLSDIDVGAMAATLASAFAEFLSTTVLVVLYLTFLMSERLAWIDKLPRLAETEENAERLRKVTKRISNGVKQYMWVNAVTSAMSGAVAFLIFSWIQLDFAPLLALIVFAAGFIPNIGAFIGIALPSSVALLQFDEFTPFLIVLFGYGLADQFIANVIQPSMQGRSLNLSPFMVMISLTFWATIWGGIGAFLAIPMMVVTMVICAEIPAARWIAVLLSGDGLLQQDEAREAAKPADETRKDAQPSGLFYGVSKTELEDEIKELRADFENRDQ